MAKKKIEKTDTSNKPWISNYPPLRDWLTKHMARCLWQLPHWSEDDDYGVRGYVEAWIFPKTSRIAIIQIHANKMGWEITTPADTRAIDGSLLDAELRLGLVK